MGDRLGLMTQSFLIPRLRTLELVDSLYWSVGLSKLWVQRHVDGPCMACFACRLQQGGHEGI